MRDFYRYCKGVVENVDLINVSIDRLNNELSQSKETIDYTQFEHVVQVAGNIERVSRNLLAGINDLQTSTAEFQAALVTAMILWESLSTYELNDISQTLGRYY